MLCSRPEQKVETPASKPEVEGLMKQVRFDNVALRRHSAQRVIYFSNS